MSASGPGKYAPFNWVKLKGWCQSLWGLGVGSHSSQRFQAIIFTLQCYYQEVVFCATSFSVSLLMYLETDKRACVLSIISSKYSSCLKGEGGPGDHLAHLGDSAALYRSVNQPLASGLKDTAWWAGKTLRSTKLPLTLRAHNLIDFRLDLQHHLFLIIATHLHDSTRRR